MNDLQEFADALAALSSRPSRRFRWINWLVWAMAAFGIVIMVAYYGLTISHWLFGWPAN